MSVNQHLWSESCRDKLCRLREFVDHCCTRGETLAKMDNTFRTCNGCTILSIEVCVNLQGYEQHANHYTVCLGVYLIK
jgi:hypothetical protein